MHKALQNMLQLQALLRQPAVPRRLQRVQEAEIKKVRHRLPADLRRHFEHLLHHGRSPVAALTESGVCGNCHLKLTPSQVLHIHWATEQIHSCPHCGCFLYAPPEMEKERRAAA
jgi:predicted  nucleic acid-binding Zn-ribbon protein